MNLYDLRRAAEQLCTLACCEGSITVTPDGIEISIRGRITKTNRQVIQGDIIMWEDIDHADLNVLIGYLHVKVMDELRKTHRSDP